LEGHHGFIQWLFPELNRQGSNPLAQELNKAEAKAIREDIECAKRVLTSYKMMLNFYGIKLVNEQTGELTRNEENYKERYSNMMKHTHNHDRIRRIIRSLGQLGFARYRKPLVDYLTKECEAKYMDAHCKYSLEQKWKPALNVDDPSYIQETTETASDRTESVYFTNKT